MSKWFKKADVSDDDSEEEESEEELEVEKKTTTAPAKGTSKWFKKSVNESDEEEEEDSEEESDEEMEVPKDTTKSDKKPTKASKWLKKGGADESESESESDSDKDNLDESDNDGAPKKKASKWLKKAGADDSDSDSDMDDLDDSDDDDQKVTKKKRRVFDESDDEEESKTKVISHKRKRLNELADMHDKISTVVDENRWKESIDEMVNLNKLLEKSLRLETITKVPSSYIKAILEIEDKVQIASKNKALKKELNSDDFKAINSVKLRIKQNNASYEKEIEEYKKNPEEYIAEELFEEEEENEEEEEDVKKAEKKTKGFWKGEEQESEGKKSKKRERSNKNIKKKTDKKVAKEEIVYTDDIVEKEFASYREKRGRKGINFERIVKKLQFLTTKTNTPSLLIRLLSYKISTQFDQVLGVDDVMELANWEECYFDLIQIIDLVETNKDIKLVEVNDIDIQVLGKTDNKEIRIDGTLEKLSERMYNEYIRNLQYTDPHAQEYVEKLKAEPKLLDLLERTYSYYAVRNEVKSCATLALCLVKQLHFRNQVIHEKMLKNQRASVEKDLKLSRSTYKNTFDASSISYFVLNENLEQLIEQFCTIIYQNGTEEQRIQALLCQVYHHGVYESFYKARNLLITSNIKKDIAKQNVHTQILFNRAIAQLGLCAFRNGLYEEAHTCLYEVCGQQNQKELLAQSLSIQKYFDKETKEKIERIERSRLIPFHMQINLDKLEAVHLICAMFIEIPFYLLSKHKRQSKNRYFQKLYESYLRTPYSGLPENSRECIFISANAMSKGDWRKSYDVLLQLQMWKLVAGSEGVESMLKEKIKEESLRSYIIGYGHLFENLGIKQLEVMFELSEQKIKSKINKMILDEEISASWDQVNKILVINEKDETYLQYLSNDMAEKINVLIESNEKVYENKINRLLGNNNPKQKTNKQYRHKK